jgi:hypothetical protein
MVLVVRSPWIPDSAMSVQRIAPAQQADRSDRLLDVDRQMTQGHGAQIQPDSEDDMGHEALETGLRGLGSLGRTKPKTERRLEDEQRKHDRSDAIEKSWQYGGMSLTARTRRFQPPGSGLAPLLRVLRAEVPGPLSHNCRPPFLTIANGGPHRSASLNPRSL